MPSHREMTVEEEEEFEEGGGLKKRTKMDRKREADSFYKYFAEMAEEGENMKQLAVTEVGREKISKIFSNYFYTMRVESGERPKKNYASKLRTSIKMQIIDDHHFDITDQVLFPKYQKRWKSFLNKLVEEGRGDTTHKEEVPADTLEKIYRLLWDVKTALENRGEEDYEEKYLSKIPAVYHTMLHKLLQWGAGMLLNFYEVRRGVENLDELLADSFKEFEDENFLFKYIKKITSEMDKNHPQGTNVRCNGVIPCMLIDGFFNPMEYFRFYLDFLPRAATKDDMKGGWLFPRPRKHGAGSLNIHAKEENSLYEPNMKGKFSYLVNIKINIFPFSGAKIYA